MAIFPLSPLYHNLGGPDGRPGRSIGVAPCGGYVFKQNGGPYLLCVFVLGRKADTPAELSSGIRRGSFLICELGNTAPEAEEELALLSKEDVRQMVEATIGPWARWQ